MFSRHLAVLLGVVAAVAAPATVATAAAQPSQIEQMAPPARRLDPDAAFLRTAHQGNLAQITLGRIAARKASSPEIRRLGARFAADSLRLDAAIRDTAKTLRIRLDPVANSTVRQSFALYRTTSAADFDELFLTSQAAMHDQAARLIRSELADGDQPEVTQVARGAMPLIRRHRAALKSAQMRLAGANPA
jgi:putative membrane protein